jgi:hypothetical protein
VGAFVSAWWVTQVEYFSTMPPIFLQVLINSWLAFRDEAFWAWLSRSFTWLCISKRTAYGGNGSIAGTEANEMRNNYENDRSSSPRRQTEVDVVTASRHSSFFRPPRVTMAQVELYEELHDEFNIFDRPDSASMDGPSGTGDVSERIFTKHANTDTASGGTYMVSSRNDSFFGVCHDASILEHQQQNI